MHVLYICCFLSDNVLSCSSRTAIDELECRARSCFCLSLNKLFVVVVVGKNMENINNNVNEKVHVLFYNFYFQKKYKRKYDKGYKKYSNQVLNCNDFLSSY